MFCRHSKTTWPQTPRGNAFAKPHVTCVKCGAEFAYDWKAMKRGARLAPHWYRPTPGRELRKESV